MTEHKRGRWIFFVVPIFLLSIGLIAVEAAHMGIDSDRANHLLQAKDLADGNLFLSGWNLTKAHFLTTDLFAYFIGYVFGGGLGYRAASLTYTVMYVALLLVTLIAAFRALPAEEGRGYRWFSVTALLYLCIPGWYLMGVGRIHVIAYVYCIIAMLLASSLLRQTASGSSLSEGRLKALFLLLTVGSFGDVLVFLYAALPILLFVIWRRISKKAGKDELRLAFLTALSLPVSLVLDFLYYRIGGADKNGTVLSAGLSSPRIWGERIVSLVQTIFRFAEGDPAGLPLLSFYTFLVLCNAVLVLFSLFLTGRSLIRFLLGKAEDPPSVMLAFSVVIAAGIYVFTGRSEVRYLELIAIGLMIILVRNAYRLFEGRKRSAVFRVILTVLLWLAAAGRLNEFVKGVQINAGIEARQTEEGSRLCRTLRENGCRNGYASFWNASVNTVLGGGEVTVRHISLADPGNGSAPVMQMYRWFNKNEWYEEPANFVIIDDTAGDGGASDDFGISEENCIAFFGVPAQRLREGRYILLIYDCDLSQKLYLTAAPK